MTLYNPIWWLKDQAGLESARSPLGRFKRKIFALLYRCISQVGGFYIPPTVTFASIPVFPHGRQGVLIARGARLGKDCVIFHQVTIGANQIPDSKGVGSPKIGDRCYIGAGAKIIGGIEIGNDVRIGANAVVTMDVPDNATVVGVNVIRPSEAPRDNRFYFVGKRGWCYYEDGRSFPAPKDKADALRKAFMR